MIPSKKQGRSALPLCYKELFIAGSKSITV